MELTIFSHGQGEGCILDQGETLAQFFELDHSPIQLGNCLLESGKPTEMDGYFCKPVEYAGRHENTLFFLLGTGGADLFESAKTYYETMLRLTENRFYRNYSWKGGRDLNFVNGKWK